jgi:imidazolonepropionase-like amidohydrolase
MRLRLELQSPFHGHTTLDIHDGRWVEPSGQPDSTLGERWWALPGLVDAHSHLARDIMDLLPGDYEGAVRRAGEALGRGVMLALDKGWTDLTIVDVIDQVPPEARPEIEAAGRIHAVEGGYFPGFATNIEPGSVESTVRKAAMEGRGWVKLIGDWPRSGQGPKANFSEEELETAVRVAAANGARVAIHTMAREVPSIAVRAGVQSIEHGPFLSGDDLDQLGASGGIWVPTVVQVEAIIQQLGVESSGGRLLAEGLGNIVRLLPDAVDAGVKVLTGTDLAVATREVAAEAVRLWELGMPARDVVLAVSMLGFRATGRPMGFEPGDPANAVLFDENPVENPRVLAHPELVIRHGRVVE